MFPALHADNRCKRRAKRAAGEKKCHSDCSIPDNRSRLGQMDKPFSLLIRVHPDHFQVEVNGLHLADFQHRISWQAVKFLHVDGCCRLDMVEYQ